MYKVVENNPMLVRNDYSNALINIDSDGYKNYMNTRKRMESQNNELMNLKEQVSILTTEFNKIKQLLGKFS